jgi:hypothetical protein
MQQPLTCAAASEPTGSPQAMPPAFLGWSLFGCFDRCLVVLIVVWCVIVGGELRHLLLMPLA